jgi:DNA-binding NtrC family response regulator
MLTVPVSTLLVCDDSSKTDQLQGLIGNQPLLKLTSQVDGPNASARILAESPSLVWIELAPEPAKGLLLLGELKEKFPRVQFLVSYETLKADLVKSAMQLGAVEYIDPENAERLLPDAIERITEKLNEAVLGKRAKVLTAPSVSEVPVVPDEAYVPGATAQNRQVSGVRSKESELAGMSMMNVGLGVLMVAMILVAIVVWIGSHH